MVSAGLDTVPGNVIMGIAYLASEDGQRVQQKAYEEILKVYPDGDAWEKCLVEEKVPYVTALVKETLRFWTVIPICLPRESTKDIVYNGATIPAGTTFFMVCWYPTLFPVRDKKFLPKPISRTHTPQTTTKSTSTSPSNSCRSGIWRWARARALPTTATGLARACAPARIWPTASCTPPTFA